MLLHNGDKDGNQVQSLFKFNYKEITVDYKEPLYVKLNFILTFMLIMIGLYFDNFTQAWAGVIILNIISTQTYIMEKLCSMCIRDDYE